MPADLAPSTAWSEIILGDEADRFARQSELITEVIRLKSAKYGRGRGLHRKQVLGLTATLEIPANLPEAAAHGLFARAGGHEVLVRLSNGGTDRAPDSVPDIRGFAIKVRHVEGPGALGGPTAAQDFLLINHPTFAMPTSDAFVKLVHASAHGRGALVRYAYRTHGPIGGLRLLKGMRSALGKPFSGFATETFWSAAPLANGPYAVRVRLVPVAAGAPAAAEPGAAALDWAADIVTRLAAGPLAFDLQLQFFVNESRTPIENPTVDWPTPYLTVGRLTIPEQDPTSATGQGVQAEAEALSFDPWAALAEHRPLGEIMRARKSGYRTSQALRGSQEQRGLS